MLIGENAWGKSSLLDALTLLLSAQEKLYHFAREDFHFPPGDTLGREHHLHIVLTFRENAPGEYQGRKYRGLAPVWIEGDDGYRRIMYRLEGEFADDNTVLTLRSFLDDAAKPIVLEEIDVLAQQITRLNPVLRLRDARFMRRLRNGSAPEMPATEMTARQLDFLARELVSRPQNLTDSQLREGLSAMVQLLEHYFSEQGAVAQRRLVRESSRVSAWRLGPEDMNAEESRRIAFHIRFNRASSLFARCWLLVEGETEVWVMNELARQCGHHFDAEGVKVIEFVQSGLRPLIKFARRMGIEWHVLVDGDEAGKKYAATVRGLLENDRERDRLTALPAMDMEHFMYRQGFSDVYHRVAHIPEDVPINMRRVIIKAIHRSSKPELAIEVAMEAGRRGMDAIPSLLRKMFSRVLWLARGRAD